MKLRDYQEQAVAAIYRYFAERRGEAPLVVAPTGSGKSLIAAAFMRQAVGDYPETRVLCVTHVRELIAQNFATLIRLWPEAPTGIYSAGIGKRQARARLLFAGVQSIHRRAREIGHVDLMLVDEAHLMPRSSDTQYGRLVESLREINPKMKIVGLTATPYRLDSGTLHQGSGSVFDGIAYNIDVAMLVERGHLAPLVSKRPGSSFDTKGLHVARGDFIEREMMARFGTEEATRGAVAEIVALGAERQAWIAFCISVEHAIMVRNMLRDAGVTAETITGETPGADRDRLIRAYKEGRIRCLTSVGVLTTGFDAPRTDLLAMLRPTQSTGLYVQMAGRGMRTADGKGDCLVLDFAGNVLRHGPIDAIGIPERGGKASAGEGEAPEKACPECGSILRIAERECPDCGHEFPPPEPKIERTASTEAIMNLTAAENWEPVRDVDYARHVKHGAPDSLRVEYLVGVEKFKAVAEWVCFEHAGYARQKAVDWWLRWAGTAPPDTVADALARKAELRRPFEAVLVREGKYFRVKRMRAIAPAALLGGEAAA